MDCKISNLISLLEYNKKIDWYNKNSILDFKNYLNDDIIFFDIFEYYIERIDKNLLNDYNFMLNLIDKNSYYIMKYVGNELKSNKNFIIAVLDKTLQAVLQYVDKNLLNDIDFICKLYKINKRVIMHLTIDMIKKFILNNHKEAFYILKYCKTHEDRNQIMNDLDFMVELIKLDFNNIKYITEWHYHDELHSDCGCNCGCDD